MDVSIDRWNRMCESGDLISGAEAGAILGVTRVTVNAWRDSGRIPEAVIVRHPFGRRMDGVRYVKDKLAQAVLASA
jgi:hypothetical protein